MQAEVVVSPSSGPLARELRLPAATALVVGQVVGVGIFLTPGSLIRTVASPAWILAVWLFIGVTAICGALCYGALAARYPHAGGGYVYLREAYGPRVAFLYGWKCLLIMDPGITAALATGLASYIAYLTPLTGPGQRLVAVGIITAGAAVHIIGVQVGARVMAAVSVLKVVFVFVLIVAALASQAGSWTHFTPFVARHPGAPALAGALAGGFVAAFFSFGGWWEVARMSGEVRDPTRTMPRALWMGLSIVTVVYMAATLAFVYAIPIERVAEGQAFIAQVGEAILGSRGGVMVALIVIVCIAGSLGVMQMVAPRLYVAMAHDGLFPASAGAIHTRLGTPARAIAIQAVLASVLALLGTFDTIVAYFIFITVAFIAATVASVFVQRRRDPTFQVPGHPWTPLAFLVMVAILLVLLLLNAPLQALLGIAVVAAALAVYRVVHDGVVPAGPNT